jgi:hypothetical protein
MSQHDDDDDDNDDELLPELLLLPTTFCLCLHSRETVPTCRCCNNMGSKEGYTSLSSSVAGALDHLKQRVVSLLHDDTKEDAAVLLLFGVGVVVVSLVFERGIVVLLVVCS